MTNNGARATSPDTILLRGLPFAVLLVLSAVFGPTHHEHENQCQSSKLGIPGKPKKRTL